MNDARILTYFFEDGRHRFQILLGDMDYKGFKEWVNEVEWHGVVSAHPSVVPGPTVNTSRLSIVITAYSDRDAMMIRLRF